MLILRWFLDSTRLVQLARDNGLSSSTAYRYLHEGLTSWPPGHTGSAQGCAEEDITVCILERPRHKELAEQVRTAGARIKFISDVDVAGVIAAARDDTGVDLLLGIGGTPEGIIAACAIKCLGGVIQGRLWPRDDTERRLALEAGHDLDQV